MVRLSVNPTIGNLAQLTGKSQKSSSIKKTQNLLGTPTQQYEQALTPAIVVARLDSLQVLSLDADFEVNVWAGKCKAEGTITTSSEADKKLVESVLQTIKFECIRFARFHQNVSFKIIFSQSTS